jgi:3-oxoacyl-[acyl-carrier-protein] synthase III
LEWRGNTGAASIFIMLAEFLETHQLEPGQTIFCYVPESARFSTAYFLLEVVALGEPLVANESTVAAAVPKAEPETERVPAPHAVEHEDARTARLLRALAVVWHDYRSRAWRTPLIRRLRERRLDRADYLAWMECWIPQVREGSHWMRNAVASLRPPFDTLAALVEAHAQDEQFDFNILFRDYRAAGGQIESLDALRRNPGGEALNAYLHALASKPNPVGLLGAIYVIEGTGQRIIPALLPLLKAQLDLPASSFRFLDYHGANDEHHLKRWLQALTLALTADASVDVDRQILLTAQRTAELYLLQLGHVLDEAQ